jgi:membrane associated rhomboid family serine protease
MFKVLTNYVNKHKLLILSIAIGFIASLFARYSIPTVGASSMVYAMVGIMYGLVCREVIIVKVELILINFVIFVVFMAISYFTKSSNFWVHADSSCLGLIISMFFSKYLKK